MDPKDDIITGTEINLFGCHNMELFETADCIPFRTVESIPCADPEIPPAIKCSDTLFEFVLMPSFSFSSVAFICASFKSEYSYTSNTTVPRIEFCIKPNCSNRIELVHVKCVFKMKKIISQQQLTSCKLNRFCHAPSPIPMFLLLIFCISIHFFIFTAINR